MNVYNEHDETTTTNKKIQIQKGQNYNIYNPFSKFTYFVVCKTRLSTFVWYFNHNGCTDRRSVFVGAVNFWFAFTLLHGELASGLELTRLASDLTFVGHIEIIKHELMLATTQVFNFDTVGWNNWFPVKQPFCWGSLVLELDFKNELVSFDSYCVLQFLVEGVLIWNFNFSH